MPDAAPTPPAWSPPLDAPAAVIQGDCLAVMAAMPACSVDAIVTDAPYGLEFMGKEWDTFRVDKRSARWAGSENTGGAGAGFGEIPGGAKLPSYGRRRTTSTCRTCGKRDAFRNPHACGDRADWTTIPVDAAPVESRAFQNWCSLWAVEALRVLKPGGHLLCFGGSRMFHRLACGLEDAGFEVRDVLCWMYASGFPKSLDVSKAIDGKLGAEPEVVGAKPVTRVFDGSDLVGGKVQAGEVPVTAPSSNAARRWQGWGTALKPAYEPVILARKPPEGSIAENVLAHATGALNIDGCRVGVEEMPRTASDGTVHSGNLAMAGHNTGRRPAGTALGRWPANVLLDELAAAMLDEQSGERPTSSGELKRNASIGYGGSDGGESGVGYGDSGGASRFFYTAKASRAERDLGTPSDGRNRHPTVKPVSVMRWLVRLVAPHLSLVLDPFGGSGTTGVAAVLEGARPLLIERDEESARTAAGRMSRHAMRRIEVIVAPQPEPAP